MLSENDPMTAYPVPRPASSMNNANNNGGEVKPIVALKELVASLYREQHKIQNLLSSLGFALRSFNNLNQFLDLTPLMAARVADADGGALILSKSNGQLSLEQLHSQDNQTSQDLRQSLEKIILQLNHQPGGDNTFVGSPLESLDHQLRLVLGPGVQIYHTPILIKNSERGRLYIFSRNPEYSWTSTRRKLLQLVADQTSVAIANNELTSELRSKERQDRELEIASEIQLRLLPRKCPSIQGIELAAICKTANRVGGDYYDFIPTRYDRHDDGLAAGEPWSIVIGDVMGKGVPAGLIMTMTRGMLRAEVLNRHSPAQILTHLNRVMYADLENSHRFVTLFYSEYDPQTQKLSFSNAAHYPPLLWKAQTKTVESLDTEGALIGLNSDSYYQDGEVQLQSGDILVYYTDGFTDAMNNKGERFDQDNWEKAFNEACQTCEHPQNILDFLFERVEKFTGSDKENTDDMTLVVMRVKSS